MGTQPPRKRKATLPCYRVGALGKGLCILDHLDRSERPLRVQEIAVATGFDRVTAFRLLCTLESHGYIERLPDKRYRGVTRRRRIRIGYSAPLAGTPFRRDVTEGIRRAAEEMNIELLLLNNPEDSPEVNVRNADASIEAKVDLVMEFQPFESITHVLADRFSSAGIPVVGIETPIPGGVYFGANNYRAGKMAGRVLGQFAAKHWKGRFDRIVLIASSSFGSAHHARLTGGLDGIREVLGEFNSSRVTTLDGHTHAETSRIAVAEFLRDLPRNTRLLISALNDPSAIGALQAVRAAGREEYVAIVGHNATIESRAEIRKPESRLIASVAYFPERYGEKLIRLARSIVNHERVPLAVYTDHLVLDRHNIDQYYPANPAPPKSRS
jgi:ribose transport system substrate-binding protein